jgi:hypothetical protein
MYYFANMGWTPNACELYFIRLRHQISWLDLPPQHFQMLIIDLFLLLSLRLVLLS